jgi:hypothetical protein
MQGMSQLSHINYNKALISQNINLKQIKLSQQLSLASQLSSVKETTRNFNHQNLIAENDPFLNHYNKMLSIGGGGGGGGNGVNGTSGGGMRMMPLFCN